MKKLKKLAIKKVTLKDLDEKPMEGIAGATAVNTLCATACTARQGHPCC